MYQVKSPILFLIFNRFDEAKLVFDQIIKVKPKVLFIASDGVRENIERDKVNNDKIKKYIKDNLTWAVEVKTLYRDKNLGCREAVSSAITWFFDQVEEGIVLEDDCLPNIDFFRFCDEMLNRYREDDEIGHIAGANFQEGRKIGNGDYYYSRLTNVWGWAGWRRNWRNYDIKMDNLDVFLKNGGFNKVSNKVLSKMFLERSYQRTKRGEINTWDYQYAFANLYHDKLSVVPNVNLISNIGFGENSTHTSDGNSELSNKKLENLKSSVLQSPTEVKASFEADSLIIHKETPSVIALLKLEIKEYLKSVVRKK